MSLKVGKTLQIAGVAMIALTAAQASAQTQPPKAEQPDGALADIIVTAQRTETNLQNTPISVTAVSGETLKARGSSSLLDVATFTPNLSIASNGGGGLAQSSFAIRGMGVGSQDSSAAVGVYVDEVYSPSFFGNVLGLLDISRIEVLRGPQGTLFGRNTIAGAVQYVSVKPSRTLGGYLEGTLGNDARRMIDGALNIPVGDTLALRVAGSYDNQGGYVTDDLNHIKRGRSQVALGRVQLRWTPTSDLTVDLKAEIGDQRNNGRPVAVLGVEPRAQFASLASIFGEPRPLTPAYISTQQYHFAGFNSPDSFRSSLHTYQGVIKYDLSDSISLKSISAYIDNKNHALFDFDNTPLTIMAFDRGQFVDKVFTQELQLTGKSFDKRLHWTAGAFYYDGRQTVRGTKIVIGQFFPINPDDNEIKTRSIAAYGDATFDLTDQLSVAAGLRYTNEKVSGIDLTSNQTQSSTYTDWSPHLGLNFQASSDILFYAKASKGFRAGGYNINSLLPNGSLGFAPETAWTYELGARMEFLEHRLRINPTVFYTDWKNIQFQRDIATMSGPVGATQNAGDAHVKGAELEMLFAATPRLTLNASGSLLRSHYTRVESFILSTYPFGFLAALAGVPGSIVPVVNLTTSSPLQQSPDYKYSLGARYSLSLAQSAKANFNIDWGYTDHIRIGVTDGNSITIPGYGLLNARVQYVTANGHFSVAVFGTNLLDKYHLTGGDGKGKGFTVGTDQGDVGRPREYGVTLRAAF